MGEIVRRVDVEGEARVAAHLDTQTAAPVGAGRQRLGEVGAERTGAVAEAIAASTGRASTLVPPPARSGTRQIVPGRDEAAKSPGQRQVTVGDHEMVEALARDRRPARLHRTVETDAGRPQHLGADRVGPRGHGLVVARDEHRQRTGCSDDPSGEPLGERDALAVVEQPGQAALGERGSASPGSAPPASTGVRIGSPRLRSPPVATTGVVGQRWRARSPTAGSSTRRRIAAARWYVAADDRWHDPQTDTGGPPPSHLRHGGVRDAAAHPRRRCRPAGLVRRRRAAGARSSPSHNDSPAPFAVAFTRRDLATSRPPADVPVDGIDLPAESLVLPVGHRSTITVGLAHRRDWGGTCCLAACRPTKRSSAAGSPGPTWPAGSTCRSPIARRGRAGGTLRAAARRCRRPLTAEPERHLLGLGELVRLGELDAAERRRRSPRRRRRRRRAARAACIRSIAPPSTPPPSSSPPPANAGRSPTWPRLRRRARRRRLPRRASADLTDGDVAADRRRRASLLAGATLFPAGIPAALAGHRLRGPRPRRRHRLAAVAGRAVARRQRRRAVGGRRGADHAHGDRRRRRRGRRRSPVARRSGGWPSDRADRHPDSADGEGPRAYTLLTSDDGRQCRLACGISSREGPKVAHRDRSPRRLIGVDRANWAHV